MPWFSGLALFLASPLALAAAAAPRAPADTGPPAVVALLEDAPEAFIGQLNNDGGWEPSRASRDFRDFYSGVCSVRVTPFQRFSSGLPGWNYPIAEKPGPGQYRYLRFAWKRLGGAGIMVQFHNTVGSWNQRFYAGKTSPATATWGPMIRVSAEVPDHWVVVTRDLFKDFGPMRLNGFALTPMDGGSAGLFDHVYLGRSVADLDRASAAAFGKPLSSAPLGPDRLAQLWQDLGSRDVAVAGKAVRSLLVGRKESVAFLAGRLKARPLTADEKHILKLIADLDDNRFRAREDASRELEKLGDSAAPFLEAALRQNGSLEVRRRAAALLKGRRFEEGGLTIDQLRLLRVIRILEWSGMPAAREALEKAAGGTLEAAGLTPDARQALARMKKDG
jgi:hypothetical protein